MRLRPGTSDENIYKEVVEKHCYRRKNINFDVMKGERWLDLGANIGAFAEYCRVRDATCVCYEPDVTCFTILKLNTKFKCVRAAVTASKRKYVRFYQHKNKTNWSRGSTILLNQYRKSYLCPNVCVGTLRGFDGIKMDIEGSEFEILDQRCLPKCKKLVLEYHTSRDSSVANLVSRLKYLGEVFKNVKYPPEYDRVIASKAVSFKSFYDRLIFCWNEK